MRLYMRLLVQRISEHDHLSVEISFHDARIDSSAFGKNIEDIYEDMYNFQREGVYTCIRTD